MRRPAMLALLLLVGLRALCQSPTSGELVENAREWDGKAVTYTGEAIGEAMRRGTMAWIHLNDDAYMWRNIEEGAALGGYNSGQAVWLTAELAARIRFFGDFKHEGDVVEVTGVFSAACAEHGGDMDIHATTLRIVRPGHAVEHGVDRSRLVAAALMVSLTLIALAAQRHARRRRA
jgi:hypothetical protein